MQITKLGKVSAYVYGGKDRESATESVSDDNEKLAVGKPYLFEASKGMLLVAYPDPGETTTEFEFTYWSAETPVNYTPIIIAVAVVVVILLIFCTIKLIKHFRRDKNLV